MELESPSKPSKPVISIEEWIVAIQEEQRAVTPVRATTITSYPKLYPKLWKLVGTLNEHWISEKWEIPLKAKNKTDFKRKVIKKIINMREKKTFGRLREDIRLLYPKTAKTAKVFVLSLADYMAHATEHYKVDKAATEERLLATVNDKLRLAGILALHNNRDDTIKLGRGKGTVRADVDCAMGWKDSIFHRFAMQMSDIGLVLGIPDRAKYLHSFGRMDPNDWARVDIRRDYKWVSILYRSLMTDYSKSLKNWQKGTGGGSGYPENYSDWNERDAELFTNYASAGKGDYLAWIYMLDQKEGFIFNIANAPAPDDSILADGVAGGTQEGTRGTESSGAKKRKKKGLIDDVGKAINESVKAMAENIANLSKYVVETHKPFVKEIKHWMEEMDAASDSISKLSKARNDLFV